MVVDINWQFDVDDSDGETLQDCIRIAMAEMESQLKNGDLTAEDFTYTVRPDLPTIYQAPINERDCRPISFMEFMGLKKGDTVVFKERGEYRINKVIKATYRDRVRDGLFVETTDGWGDMSNLYILLNRETERYADEPYKSETPLVAVIHQYPEGDHSVWELPVLSDADARAIDEILDKYSNQGCSNRSIDYNALFK